MMVTVAVQAQTSNWPQIIKTNNGYQITLYQPQPENLQGNTLTARAAVSVKTNNNTEPVFGAIWFTAHLDIDKANRTVEMQSIHITQSKIGDNTNASDYTKTMEAQIPSMDIVFALDELLSSIKQEQQQKEDRFNTAPPEIIYTTKPTTLVSIDGNPQLSFDKDLGMERVLNTPFLLFKNKSDNAYYLRVGGFWYKAPTVMGDYQVVQNLPGSLSTIDVQVKTQEQKAAADKKEQMPANPTAILVKTTAAELIQTEGEADYTPIRGTDLLYANNSLDEIFKDINSQKTYTLLAGRWYSANDLNGPWSYIPADQLPADFAKIPKGSEKDGVLAHVAGTQEANEAVLEAQIPQTAKISRATATVKVEYDGRPKFVPIQGTSLRVAENSNITVLQAANLKYYACDKGVWYISDSPNGPYSVANERPQDVDKIPPTNHAYNTRYVYVYESTPDYVYMGYTPGYLGNYVFGPTVVYGTGWYYHPWYGVNYYPRPATWGFGFSYNPWSGWNASFNIGWSFGWGGAWGRPWGWGGWYGPLGYVPPVRVWGWNGGYYGWGGYAVRNPNIMSNRPVVINNNYNTNIIRNNNTVNNNINVYNRVPGATSTTINPRMQNNNRSISNNVITDREGNIFRRDQERNNWNQRANNNWSNVQPMHQNQLPQLERAQTQRERGVQRDNMFRGREPMNNPAPRMSAPAPMPRMNNPMPRMSSGGGGGNNGGGGGRGGRNGRN